MITKLEDILQNVPDKNTRRPDEVIELVYDAHRKYIQVKYNLLKQMYVYYQI